MTEVLLMPSKDFLRGNMNVIILSSLTDGDKYGYEITKKITDLTGGAIRFKEGSLYPALHRLEKMELVEGYWVQQEQGKPGRKYYRITDKGMKTVEQEKSELKINMELLGRVLYGNEGN
jgi:PadR family transcriptional regulator PadR